MFYEIRCGDLFPGKQLQRFDKHPEPGDLLAIGPITFGVMEVKNENGRPVVELFVL